MTTDNPPTVEDAAAQLERANAEVERCREALAAKVAAAERAIADFQRHRDDKHAEAIRLSQLEVSKADTFLEAARRDLDFATAAKNAADRAAADREERQRRETIRQHAESVERGARELGSQIGVIAKELAILVSDADPAVIPPGRVRAMILLGVRDTAGAAGAQLSPTIAMPVEDGAFSALVLALLGYDGAPACMANVQRALDGSLDSYLSCQSRASSSILDDHRRSIEAAEPRRVRRLELEKSLGNLVDQVATIERRYGKNHPEVEPITRTIERYRAELDLIRKAQALAA